VRARALPVGHCHFGEEVCCATKTTAGDRRADAENEDIRTVVFPRSTVVDREIEWKSSGGMRRRQEKKTNCYFQSGDSERLLRSQHRRPAKRDLWLFSNCAILLFITRIENDYSKTLMVSPALLLDDRLRVNDWLAAVEYAK